MKKKLFIIAFTMISAMTASAQNTPAQEFMGKYKNMVESVEALNPEKPDTEKLDSLKTVYKQLTKEVSTVKKMMASTELEEYYKLKGRYQKKIAVMKAKRSASAVKGWVEGMVNK